MENEHNFPRTQRNTAKNAIKSLNDTIKLIKMEPWREKNDSCLNTHKIGFLAQTRTLFERFRTYILCFEIAIGIFEFGMLNNCLFFVNASAIWLCFSRWPPAWGDCRKLKEKSIATPPTYPHAELYTKRNTAHPFPYYVTRIERDGYTSVRSMVKQPQRPPISSFKMADWRLTFTRQMWRLCVLIWR